MIVSSESRTHKSHASRLVYAVILLFALALGAVYYAVKFAQSEFQRDLRNWENRLGTTATIRADAINRWVTQQQQDLDAIANNMSLKLYMTELGMQEEDGSDPNMDPAEYSYLRNFITATAERTGFASKSVKHDIKASMPATGTSGIALLDAEGKLILSTDNMPPLTEWQKEFIRSANTLKPAMSAMYKGTDDRPSLAFVTPIFSIQGDVSETDRIGIVFAFKTVDDSLFPLLNYPHTVPETEESYLVTYDGDVAHFLTPLKDGTPAMFRKLTLDNPELDAAFARNHPNAFGIVRNYNGRKSLVTGRPIAGTPWHLIHAVSRNEALHESDQRRNSLIAIGTLLILAIFVILILVWRHGISIRVAREAARYKRLAHKFESQGMLLNLISENQPDPMFILDEDFRYCFANKASSRTLSVGPHGMVGKDIDHVLGPHRATPYKEASRQLFGQKTSLIRVNLAREEDGTEHFFQTKYIPLDSIPSLITHKEDSKGVLVVDQDITQSVKERERRERMLSQTIDTLVAAVDFRDPFASSHSTRVSRVAKAVAEEMGLEERLTATTTKAAKLMNIGKIYLSPELLTKKGKLTKKEKEEVTESIHKGATLLEKIDFDGPLAETLRQSQENWDGSGPLSLKEKEIVLPARIIRVANAFVAMASPRSYRGSMDKDQVFNELLKEVGHKFDRRVVAALINYFENKDALFHEFCTPETQNDQAA